MTDKPDTQNLLKFARELRRKHNITGTLSFKDLLRISNEIGVKIFETDQLPSGVQGVLIKLEKERKQNIILDSTLTRSKLLFTASHELGHFLLHHESISPIDINSENLQKSFMKYEYEANEFANLLIHGTEAKKIVRNVEYLITRLEDKLRVDPIVRSQPSSCSFKSEGLRESPLVQVTVLNRELLREYQILEEFEDLINDPTVPESRLQQFFENYPRFLMASEYKDLKAHIVLSRKDNTDLIPDFFLQSITDELWDIIEIKKPTDIVLVGPTNRPRFSANVMKACSQLREYRAYFDDTQHRRMIEKKFKVKIYKPNIALIIGRRSEFSAIDFRSAESDLHDLRVIAYDDILQKALAFTKDKTKLVRKH